VCCETNVLPRFFHNDKGYLQASSSLALPAVGAAAGGNQRRLLQDGKLVLQLSDPAIVSKVLNFAHQSVLQSSDPTVRDSVSPVVDDATIKAASAAIANINAHADTATNAQEIEKTSFLVQTKVCRLSHVLFYGAVSTYGSPLCYMLRLSAWFCCGHSHIIV
jgi:hypothetical protein